MADQTVISTEDLVVTGNLKVTGSQITTTSTDTEIKDRLITLNKGGTLGSNTAGIEIESGGSIEATIGYTAAAGWNFGNKNITTSGTISGTISLAANSVDETMIDFGTGANQVNTDDLPEGSNNKYFTTTGATIDTDALPQGSTNLYYTDAQVQAVSINEVVEDTSPQLGGNLESNGSEIQMADNNKIALGTGERGYLRHTGASGKVQLFSTVGGIDIRTTANDETIAISSDDGSGGIANYIIADGSTGATELYHYGSKKIATTSTGVEVTGSTTSETLISTIATGTAPLTVTSTTMVSNLNADKLDDKEFTDIIAEATALAIALGQNMAQTFKNYTAGSIGTTPTTVYTVASATTSILIGVNLANTTASQITVSAQLGTTYIVKDAPIPSGGALSVLEGKIIAEAADTIVVTSDTASSCDAIVSVLEQT